MNVSEFVSKAHGSQLYNGKSYFTEHILKVVDETIDLFLTMSYYDAFTSIVQNMDARKMIQVAYLHDILEDTDVTDHEIETEFSPEVVKSVRLLTKPKTYPYDLYIEDLLSSNDAMALLVKYADNRVNFNYPKIARQLLRHRSYSFQEFPQRYANADGMPNERRIHLLNKYDESMTKIRKWFRKNGITALDII